MNTKTIVVLLVVIIPIVVEIIRCAYDSWQDFHIIIPGQLVQIVKQAYFDQEYQTVFDIKLSDEMKTALRAPFLNQLQVLGWSEQDVVINSLNAFLVSHKLKTGELSGVVSMTFDLMNKASNCQYLCPKVKLRIVTIPIVQQRLVKNWIVSSVEQVF